MGKTLKDMNSTRANDECFRNIKNIQIVYSGSIVVTTLDPDVPGSRLSECQYSMRLDRLHRATGAFIFSG